MGHGLETYYVHLTNNIHMTQEGEGDPKKSYSGTKGKREESIAKEEEDMN